MTIHFNKYGDSLGTRQLGAQIRSEIELLLAKNEKLIFDFDGVQLIANSFADECFGKLIFAFEFSILKNKIEFKNANEFNRQVIKNVFRQRTLPTA